MSLDNIVFSQKPNNYLKNTFSKFRTHEKGCVIFGAPGIGKTTYIINQKPKDGKKDWIDTDDLFGKKGTNAHFNAVNKNPSSSAFKLNYLRCDYSLELCKSLGFRIIGALFWQHVPDAIVILSDVKHKEYLKKRKDLNLQMVNNVNQILRNIAKEHNVPIFNTIEEAVSHCNKKLDNKSNHDLNHKSNNINNTMSNNHQKKKLKKSSKLMKTKITKKNKKIQKKK